MGYIKKHRKFQITRWLGSAPSILEKYTKEILKNPETGYFSVWHKTQFFFDIYKYGVCQSNIHVIYVIFEFYDICHLACIYISILVSKEALEPQECSKQS